MRECFPKPNSLEANVKVELDLPNHETKADLKDATGVDTDATDVANLKPDGDKLDIDKLKIIPTNLSNLENKVDKLDVDELVPVPVDLSKLSDVVKNDVVKKDVHNAKIKNIKDKIPDTTNLATNASLNAKINEVKGEIPSINNLATSTTALTAVETPNVSNLVKEVDHDVKLSGMKNKYFTTYDYNKFTNNILDSKFIRI